MSKLEDISTLIGSGITPLRSNNLFWNKKEIPWLKTEQLGEFIIYDTNEYISKYALDNTPIKLFPKNTISLAMYGEGKTRGNVSILGREMCSNQACCNIVVNESLADYRYVYYWLKNNYLNLRNLAVGVRKNLNSDDIKKFKIDLKTLPIQKQIADLLYCIDSKIQNNNQINSELESLAKTLYDYWFLQFEFPNEEGKPYKSSGGKMVYNEQLKKESPEGWEVAKISNLSKLISGYPFKTENFLDGGKYKIYTIKNVQDGFIDNVTDNNIDFIPKDINKDCVLSYGDLIMSLTGNVGRVGLVFEENALLNQRVLKIKPLDGFFNYIYLTFRKNAFKNIMQRIAGGTSQKNLSPNQVGDYLVVKPNKQILALFNDKLNGFFDSFINNLRQNQELTKLRDFLLPLLMNGQVTIQDAEKQVKEVIKTTNKTFNTDDEKFNLWLQNQGIAARGDVDLQTLREIFDAMDEDDK